MKQLTGRRRNGRGLRQFNARPVQRPADHQATVHATKRVPTPFFFMENNNRLLEQRTNTALGQIAALAQRVDRLEAGPSDRPDPMEISLQILQDIATEIANLREAQCRTLLILCQGGNAIVVWKTQPVWLNPDHETSWLEIDNCIVASEMPLALARNLLLAILEARRQEQGFFDVGEWIRAHR